MATPLMVNLVTFVIAALLLYTGTQLLFGAFGIAASGRPLWRGVVLALPVVGCGIGLAACGYGERGLAIAVAAATVMLTLGTGVIALGAGATNGVATPLLRPLGPLAGVILLVGFSGTVTLTHAVFIAAVAGLFFWARPDVDAQPEATGAIQARSLLSAILLFCLGAVATVFTVLQLGAVVPIAVTTPAVVLMLAVAALGLLATESQGGNRSSSLETVVGYVVAALGVAVPLTICTAIGRGALFPTTAVVSGTATTQPATLPVDFQMPVSTWRLDSVLLVVISLYLVPAGFGRARLGRADGYFLVAVGVAFVITTVATLGRLIG